MFTLLFGSYEFPNRTFEMFNFAVENNLRDESIPRKHGAVILTPYLKPRRIRIKGIIHNSTAETSHTQWLAMQAALLAGEGKLYYRSDRYINCFARSIKPDPEDGSDRAIMNVDIDMLASVPFFYSAAASYSTVVNPVKGTTLLFNVYSGGNVFAQPKISLCATGGTITDDAVLDNLTSGQQMQFRGSIPNGATLEINIENLLVNVNSADALSYFDGDFIHLLPGTNSFQFVGGTFSLTMEHKYRWY